MSSLPLDQKIAALRRFTRFFGQRLGPLEAGPAGSSYSATEVRVLAELALYDQRTVTTLSRSLGLDAGYLSRVLRRLEQTGVIARATDAADSRQQPMALTEAGRAEVRTLDSITTTRYAALVRTLPAHVHAPLLDAMERIEGVFGTDVPGRDAAPWLLRQHRTGDVSHVVQRAIASTTEEFDLGGAWESEVLSAAAVVLQRFDAARDCIWIAERSGVPVGSVFVHRSQDRDGQADVVLLHVESHARGIGIGRRLIAESIDFATRAGYTGVRMELLEAMKTARALIHAAGLRHVGEASEPRFGRSMQRQTWHLALPVEPALR
ncbi:MAG TPA: bifunctional helix-turn-helix transcriptional regulator/GNAT family N-acetyltransferase [Gemmatimonadaceae bacterium]|nr:bifunctional helix-turn-helix transcriptional regulator/GNAT family N-acetyltransferase [Gemmatimonadaceae bacterium]